MWRPMGELAHAVAIFVGGSVAPELVLQFAIGADCFREAVVSLTCMVSGSLAQIAVFGRRDNRRRLHDDEHAVHFAPPGKW